MKRLTYPTLLLALAVPPAAWSQTFPAPTEWQAPADLPPAPGDAYAPPGSGLPPAGAPVVSGWNETVLPGEPFTLTGDAFTTRTGTAALSDTKIWLWAAGLAAPLRLRLDLNPVLSGPANPLSSGYFNSYENGNLPVSTEQVLNSRVPSSLPFGQYLVWVENAAGRSAPVPLNRPQLTWLGPRGPVAAPGATHRAFGKNLSAGHGLTTAYVYAQPAGGGSWQALPVTSVEPYAVGFTVPAAPGSYLVRVHSGHGGAYGWSEALPLTVEVPWQRAPREVVVAPSGGDDTAALNDALYAMGQQPGAGTVRLLAGTYTIGALWLPEGVRLLGAGKDLTRVESRTARFADVAALMPSGDHVTVQDLTLLLAASSQPQYGAYKPMWPGWPHQDLDLLGVRFAREAGTKPDANIDYYAISRAEIAGCEFDLPLNAPTQAWVHDNVFHGGRMGPREDGAEAAIITFGSNLVVERNHAETPNWPVGPGGSRNYNDFLTQDQLKERTWCRRLLSSGAIYTSIENWYVAHNTTTDVAVDENKGEIILLHGAPTRWLAQVASVSDRTLSIRTDGTIYGQSQFTPLYSSPIAPARTVAAQISYGNVLDGEAYAIIIRGPGVGQARKVVALTPTTLTVDQPWRVLPTSQSVVTMAFLYRNPVVYANDLAGFPAGYVVRQHSASCGVQFDGNCWGAVAENNTATRTAGTFNVGGSDTGPTYWTEMRNVRAIDPLYYTTYSLWSWAYDNPRVGLDLVGSRFAEAQASQPLPVQLTAFTAACAPAGGAQLRWQTASEQNSRDFTVERAADGRTFTALATLPAAGSSTRPLAYAWLDAHPLPGPAYYRLRQTDRDGRVAFSPVAVVAAGCPAPPEGGLRLSLSPNPAGARAYLSWTGASPGPLTVEVRNPLGALVRTLTPPAGGVELATTGLAPGVYLVSLHDGAQRATAKLVVAP